MTAKNNISTPMNFKEGLEDLMKDAAMARPHPSRVTSLPPKAIEFTTSVLLHSATLLTTSRACFAPCLKVVDYLRDPQVDQVGQLGPRTQKSGLKSRPV
jgi:hypothetical protein